MKLPQKLSRKAVKQFFPKLSEVRWEYLFRHEKENGIHELRVSGPFDKAYYSGEGIKEWLLTEGTYKPDDFFASQSAATSRWDGLVVRKHALAD